MTVIWCTLWRKSLLFLVLLYSKSLAFVKSANDPWRELWSNPSKKKDEATTVLGGTEIVPESDLRDHNRRIWIITTACLPWLTGN